jgi:hypothetical protein
MGSETETHAGTRGVKKPAGGGVLISETGDGHD